MTKRFLPFKYSKGSTIFFDEGKLRYIYCAAILLISYLTLQIPFLEADPNILISESRGANTDEGLHTCQIRNYELTGTLDINGSDNLVKTPLFGGWLYVVFKIFGFDLVVGRLSVLLISFILLLVAFSRHRKWAIFALPLLLLEFHFFHFFHFCLAEMLCTVLIFCSLIFSIQFLKDERIYLVSFFQTLFLSLAYYLKFQFVYSILLIPLFLIVPFFIEKEIRNLVLKKVICTSLFLILFGLFYFLFWYLPFKDTFEYVMGNQTDNRFIHLDGLIDYLKWIHGHIFMNVYFKPFVLSFYFLLPIGFYLLNRSSKIYKYLFFGLLIWLGLESHKLLMLYLPTRYLISFLFPIVLIISLILFEIINRLSVKNKALKLLPILFFVGLVFFNIKNYWQSFSSRSFEIKKLNTYFSNYNFNDKIIAGTWAPSLTWKSHAVSFPIWKDYFNDKSILNNPKIKIIIAEENEEDSSGAFKSQNINIESYADSIKYAKINHWNLKIIWLKDRE